MAYKIGEACIGCELCAQKCPARCISGQKKERHTINAALCFECGVCASYCPVSCILDPHDQPTSRIKPKERPVAVVDEVFCSGCESCVNSCPFDCIEMVEDTISGTIFSVAKVVRQKSCVGCRLCVSVCGDKEAITVQWPDSTRCVVLSERTVAHAENGSSSYKYSAGKGSNETA